MLSTVLWAAVVLFLLTGEDQSQTDQPNNLAEGHPM
jgi:hypothetical protein